MKKFTFYLFAVIANLMLANMAFGQIAQRGSTTTSGTITVGTVVIPKPAGLKVNDVMLASITQNDNDGANGGEISNSTSVLPGWSLVDGRQIASGGSGDEWHATLLYKVATVADVAAANFAFTVDAESDDVIGAIVAYFGVDVTGGVTATGAAGGPFDIDPGQFNGFANDATLSQASINVSARAAVVMFGMITGDISFNDGDWDATNPASLTELFDEGTATANDMTAGGAWGIRNTAGATGAASATATATGNNGSILIALRSVAAPAGPNLWATSSSGTQVSSFTVLNGAYINGATNMFVPSGGSTAALGRNTQPNPGAGHFYWLPNSGTNGQVDIWAATAAGGSQTLIANNFDVNGASNETLGFVRLGMDATGDGWILAGDGDNDLYLTRFDANQLAAVAPVVVDASVTLVGGLVSTFQNGDICVSGNGNIYALANNGSGVTQIFIGQPNGALTTLTKKWDLVDENGDPFTGSVNGVAFDLFGSLYISTSTGLYYIDQATVNGPAGTVECSLVFAVAGLQDLASNVFPTQSTLPVKLISFSGSLNGNQTTLNWVTENMQNFDRFEIERSTNGSNFTAIGQQLPIGDPANRTTYQYGDNISSLSENVIYYRLRLIDANGSFSYSNVIFVRKDQKGLTGLVLNPNPIIKGGMATARFEASAKGSVEFNVVDMNGKIVAKQQNNIAEGTNSIMINNLERLQAGMYILQMRNGENVLTTKFSIAR